MPDTPKTQPGLFDEPSEPPEPSELMFRCLPGYRYGHIWEDNAPEAVCQCGAKRYEQVQALVKG